MLLVVNSGTVCPSKAADLRTSKQSPGEHHRPNVLLIVELLLFTELLWVLTNTTTPTAATVTAALAAVNAAGLNTFFLATTVQTGC